jgi:hypothetical protein
VLPWRWATVGGKRFGSTFGWRPLEMESAHAAREEKKKKRRSGPGNEKETGPTGNWPKRT